MTPDPLNDEVLSQLGISRRELVRRLIAGTAFAVPVVASFDMAALTTSSAEALTPNQIGAGVSNQTFAAPQLTSGSSTTFITGTSGSFDVTANGSPRPSITSSGALPTGVGLLDSGNGSATLSGTPGANTGGVYGIELIASNGVSPDASQAFTLTVDQPPAIATPAQPTFTVGQATSFTLIATGFPAPSISQSGPIPQGLSFSAGQGDGTAIIGGTPAPGTEGAYALTILATNGLSPNASQELTLTVHAGPASTPDNHFTVTHVVLAKNGTLAFELTVPGAGSVSAIVTVHGGQTFAHTQLAAGKAEVLHVRVPPNAHGRRLIRNHTKPLGLALSVTFKPTGGSARTVRVGGLQLS